MTRCAHPHGPAIAAAHVDAGRSAHHSSGMIRALSLMLLLFLPLGLAGCEEQPTAPQPQNQRAGLPPKGPEFTGDLCALVRNRAPFTVTGRIELKGGERATFRLARNKSTRLCLTGTTFGNYTVTLVVTNFVTMPIFSCYTTVNEAIEIFARPNGEGFTYSATCR